MFKSIFKAVAVSAVAVFFCVGCGDKSDDGPDDGGGGGKGNNINNYRTITIGGQKWMAENLDYAIEGSVCYDSFPYYCEKYGRLYTWDAAMKACPSGWRLPSDAEWTALVNYAGGDSTAGRKLKSKSWTSGWTDNNGVSTDGTDDYGFSALPGGHGYSYGDFSGEGLDGYWWSSTEYSAAFAWYLDISSMWASARRDRTGSKSTDLFSVRCVQGESQVTPPGTSYTITFNANGGTVSPTSAKTGDDGKLDSLPTPTRSGYTFDGWYTAATGGTAVTISNVYNANTTIYARWTAEPVTPPSGGTFTDSRDGKTYKNIVIGTQTWMAENLNYDAEGSKCYKNSVDSCAKYGRLYNWATAMDGASSSDKVPSGVRGVCPTGWHLPSDAEWTALTDAVGDSSTAGKKLKSTSGWNSNDNGTDDYGFAALPGGYGFSDGDFISAGNSGDWWSSTEDDAYYAWGQRMGYGYEYVSRIRYGKPLLFSVRCVAD